MAPSNEGMSCVEVNNTRQNNKNKSVKARKVHKSKTSNQWERYIYLLYLYAYRNEDNEANDLGQN